jgi:tRNA A-37 threonylcarbamoyl transferase component Bud32
MAEQPTAYPYGTGRLPPGVIVGGRYMILAKIAQGGMGAVYEAKEAPTSPASMRLAIKEMSFSMLNRLKQDQQHAVVDGFHREFELLSKLGHPNLVKAYHYFEEQGRQYFVMEFIEGCTLEALMESEQPGRFLPVERVLTWTRQLCDALAYLHSQTPPIIYRDLKPSNIMEVAGSQTVKLFDFGIARFYKPGQKSDTVRFGTDGYLAPEVVAYQTQSSERTDVFALGVLLHQLLTRFDPQLDPWRRPPVRSINPDVPENVAGAIERAMAMNPAQRTQNITAVLKDLFGADAEPRLSVYTPAVTKADEPTLATLPPALRQAAAPLPVGSVPVAMPAPSRPAPQPAGPVQQPAVDRPAAARAPSAPMLDLGAVQKGTIAAGVFQVVVPSYSSGHVQCMVPWLTVAPAQFSAADSQITVHAHTAGLAAFKWGEVPGPAWFDSLPGFLRAWLGVHLKLLMQKPRKHQGYVHVVTPGAPITQVSVIVEVHPSDFRVAFGWLMTIGLMGFEVLLLLSPLLLILLAL